MKRTAILLMIITIASKLVGFEGKLPYPIFMELQILVMHI